jgi:hypothetical protein
MTAMAIASVGQIKSGAMKLNNTHNKATNQTNQPRVDCQVLLSGDGKAEGVLQPGWPSQGGGQAASTRGAESRSPEDLVQLHCEGAV